MASIDLAVDANAPSPLFMAAEGSGRSRRDRGDRRPGENLRIRDSGGRMIKESKVCIWLEVTLDAPGGDSLFGGGMPPCASRHAGRSVGTSRRLPEVAKPSADHGGIERTPDLCAGGSNWVNPEIFHGRTYARPIGRCSSWPEGSISIFGGAVRRARGEDGKSFFDLCGTNSALLVLARSFHSPAPPI